MIRGKRFVTGIALCVCLCAAMCNAYAADGLPHVFSDRGTDKTGSGFRQRAKTASFLRQLPDDPGIFLAGREALKAEIIKNAVVRIDHDLPPDMQTTGSVRMEEFRIEVIRYRSSPEVYVTADLYIPDGEGPFPAAICLHGHWPGGRRGEIARTIAQLLALNGYVCLVPDAWGAGERSTDPRDPEYHGSNLGASLMNIGKTLLGMQLSDNIRGVDLLCSLPFVDPLRIGATGASGGGNQTMWLGAIDERIRAVVPVVSAGTFESYVMNSNCVCELLPNGLTFTEEDAVLGLIAPRALKILTAMNDANPAFSHIQMLRSFRHAAAVYEVSGVPENIAYQLFNTGHGYGPQMLSAMLAWFDRHLNDGRSRGEGLEKVALQPLETPAVDRPVATTESYCIAEGSRLRESMLAERKIDAPQKREGLREVLRLKPAEKYRKLHVFDAEEGWDRAIVETRDGDLIPFLHRPPPEGGRNYTIFSHPSGKDSIPDAAIRARIAAGDGIILADLRGTGELRSDEADRIDGSLPAFHTLSRSALWLGETVAGIWAGELRLIADAATEYFHAGRVTLAGFAETAAASLLLAAADERTFPLILYRPPVSYRFDNREHVDHFNMAIHLPGILVWGDVSLAAAITGSDVALIAPVTMSGRKPSPEERAGFEKEFSVLAARSGTGAKITIVWDE